MKNVKKSVYLGLLISIYMLVSVRYYQGNLSKTVVETAIHLLTVAPFFIGGTLLLVAILRKLTGERPSWEAIIRIYLTIGIIVEFFLGLHHYVTKV